MKKIWIRLGESLKLRLVIGEGRFCPDGETYIPSESVREFNRIMELRTMKKTGAAIYRTSIHLWAGEYAAGESAEKFHLASTVLRLAKEMYLLILPRWTSQPSPR